MKDYLKNIERKFDLDDKSQYDYVLNQSERTQHLPDNLYQEFLGSLKQEDFLLYPNTDDFKSNIGKKFDVENNQILLCPGSEIGIKNVIEAFTDGGRIVSSYPAFPMYKIYSELYQCEYFGIPHEKDYTISMEKILSNITHDTDLVILANPNSPMGEYKSFDEIRILLEQDVPVLIDEAYIEFSGEESFIKYIDEYPNLMICRTFSKGYGAGGCRVGMVFSNLNNIELLSKFKQCYEVTSVSIKYCEFLMDNYKLVDSYIQNVIKEKKKLISLMKGFDIIDSNCNWIHFNNEVDNIDTIKTFESHKVLVKYCTLPHDDRKNWCRLTIQPNICKEKFIQELLNE
jgi:histidinol-phosphate aminotransferase